MAQAEREGHKPPAGKISDARAAAWLCHFNGGHEWLREVSWSRWVYLTPAGPVLYGDWKEREGMGFSNLHWCGRDASHSLTSRASRPSRRGKASLPFQPSPEFLATAEQVRSRQR